MDDKNILAKMNAMLTLLEQVTENIKKNDWDAVGRNTAKAVAIQEDIKKNPLSVDELRKRNPAFKSGYDGIREKIMARLERNTSAINEWKESFGVKIAGSKDILNNISKLYKPPKASYYIDTKE